MPYVKGNGASSRYGIMGVPGHPAGPANNFKTAEETHAEGVQRKQTHTRVPLEEYNAVAHTLSTARSMAESATSDQEVRATYGQHCQYILDQVAQISSGLQQTKEYGPGCVILPIQLWQMMTALSEWCIPVLQAVAEMLKPVKLVIQNGQTADQARQLGSYAEVAR